MSHHTQGLLVQDQPTYQIHKRSVTKLTKAWSGTELNTKRLGGGTLNTKNLGEVKFKSALRSADSWLETRYLLEGNLRTPGPVLSEFKVGRKKERAKSNFHFIKINRDNMASVEPVRRAYYLLLLLFLERRMQSVADDNISWVNFDIPFSTNIWHNRENIDDGRTI